MKKLAALVIGVMVIGAIGAYGYAHHLARPRPLPASVLAAEEALAMEGLVAIAHFNVEHAVDVEPLILGDPDDDALAENEPSEEGSTRGLIAALEAEGIDIRTVFRQWLGALLVGDGGTGAVQAWIGDIPTQRLRAALEAHYLVEVDPLDDRLLLLSQENPDTCEVSAPVAIRLDPETLVLGEPTLVTRIVERLETGAAADVDLATWRRFREPRLTAAALLVPGSTAEAIENPMIQHVAASTTEMMGPLSALFVGGQLQVMPPGLAVTLVGDARDAAWPAEQAQRFEDWRSNTLASRAEELPTLSALLGRLSVQAEGSRLEGEVLLDRAFANDFMQALVVEPLQLFFGQAGGGESGQTGLAGGSAPEEMLRDPGELPRIQEQVDLASLPAFVKPEFRGPEGVARSGIFGVWVKALRVLPEDGDVFEIELAAESTRLPNLHVGSMFSDDPRIQLRVSRVLGRDGTDLLREERCGPKRNSDGGSFMAGSNKDYRDDRWVQVDPTHSGTKTIRLRSGAQLDEVESVEGSLVLRMPTRVESVRVEAPFEGQVVERPGVRISFDASSPGEVRYTLSGNRDLVLDAWGFNARSQPLQEGGTTSMGRIGRSEKVVIRHYQGEVAALEFKLVSEEEERRYPFRFEDIKPTSEAWTADEVGIVEPQSREAFRAKIDAGSDELAKACGEGGQSADLDPFRLCLEWTQAYWGDNVNTSFELYSPDHPALRENLSGLELAIEGYTVDAEGDGAKAAFVAASGSQFASLSPDFMQPYLKGALQLETRAEEEMASKTIRGVRGHMIHRLPTRVHPLTLDVSKLGNEILYSDGSYLRLVEVGENGMHIRFRGDRSRIVQLVLRDATGERIPAAHARLQALDDVPGEWIGIIQVGGRPALLELRYALGVDARAFPFELALSD